MSFACRTITDGEENNMADPIKFGTDGWRGVIARDFTFQNCRRVAQAIADYVKEEKIKNKGSKNPLASSTLAISRAKTSD